MANSNGWGDGAANNNIGWGQGANNAIGWGSSHSASWSGLTDIVGVSAASLLLDTYTGAAVAYSLRQLRTAYTGAAIRVRRSSDNAEQDINFVGGDLDTQSLLDFVGYNLFAYSEEINQSTWTKSQLNITGTPPYIDVEISPDGTLTGDKLIENTANSSHYVWKPNTAFSTSSDYNISVYLKPAERTRVYIDSQISGAYQNATVDLSTGSVVSTTFTNTPVITAEANGWYRFSVTINASGSSVVPIRVFLDNGTTNSYIGDGTSGAYVWGFQLTKSSSVLTYEKTGANATRDAYITTWYDQSGNNNSAQAAAANQPRIVSGGVVDVVNSKPAVLGDGINDTLRYIGLSLTNPVTNFMVIDKIGTSGYFGLFNSLNSLGGAYLLSSTGIQAYQNGASFSPVYVNNNQSLISFKSATTGTDWDLYGNGTQVVNGGQNIGTTIGDRVSLFDRTNNASRCNMYMQEYIIYDSDKFTDRTAIETNINDYYSIY